MFAPDLTGTRVAAPALPMDQPMPKGAKKKEQLPEEMLAMRDYTLGDSGMSRSDGTVLLHVSHSNLKQTFFHELRLDMHSTVEAVKRKLEFHTGTSAMNCQVRRARQGCQRRQPARKARARARGAAPAALCAPAPHRSEAVCSVVGVGACAETLHRVRGSCSSSTRTRR